MSAAVPAGARPAARVLVVDDHPVNLKLARLLLAGEGLDVITARTGEDAWALLQHHRPALMLVDVRLPGLDGLELTRRLRLDPALAATRVIAITAHAMPDDEARARAAGCDAYVTKPIDTRTLPQLVRSLLGDAGHTIPPVPDAPRA